MSNVWITFIGWTKHFKVGLQRCTRQSSFFAAFFHVLVLFNMCTRPRRTRGAHGKRIWGSLNKVLPLALSFCFRGHSPGQHNKATLNASAYLFMVRHHRFSFTFINIEHWNYCLWWTQDIAIKGKMVGVCIVLRRNCTSTIFGSIVKIHHYADRSTRTVLALPVTDGLCASYAVSVFCVCSVWRATVRSTQAHAKPGQTGWFRCLSRRAS